MPTIESWFSHSNRTVTWRVAAAVAFACLALSMPAIAADEPTGEPVKWDPARVTKYAVDLNAAVHRAEREMEKAPVDNVPSQRTTWYEMTQKLRQIEDSTQNLQAKLQGGAGADETRGVFDRIETLRRDCEEQGRRAMIPEPVLDALVDAGAIHNLMMPYYHGKR